MISLSAAAAVLLHSPFLHGLKSPLVPQNVTESQIRSVSGLTDLQCFCQKPSTRHYLSSHAKAFLIIQIISVAKKRQNLIHLH